MEMRIAILEDDKILRDNLEILFKGDGRMEVVGVYGTGEEALEQFQNINPDIILTDLGLPGISGIEFIKKAKKINPEIDIMAFTVFEDRETIFSAIKAGASSYILKGTKPADLIEALFNLHDGGAPMSPKIARLVITEFQDHGIKDQYLLTPREKEIILGIEKGYSYKVLSENLNISHHTVHAHIKNIYEKLHAKNREDALIKARKKGII